MSELLTRWLGAVNQPVANEVEHLLEQAVTAVTDHGNFTPNQCVEILHEILNQWKDIE